jgi:hypothetical protein
MIKNQNHPGLRPCPAKILPRILLFGAAVKPQEQAIMVERVTEVRANGDGSI